MNYIDTTRLTGLFNEPLVAATVIGCGAIGSRLAIELAKLGVPELYLYDNDIVESHNLSNQHFTIADIGKPKVTALKERIQEVANMPVYTYNALFSSLTAPETSVVFLCVDSMKTRKELLLNLFKLGTVQHVFETRMGVDELRVYHITKDTVQHWIETAYYEDGITEVSACGTSLTVGATASICASMACWQYMKLFMKGHTVSYEIIMSLEHVGMLVT